MKWTKGLIIICFLSLASAAWMGTVYDICGENPVGSGVLVHTTCVCHGYYAYDYTNANGYYGLDLFSGMHLGCIYNCLTADDGEYTGTVQGHGEYQNTPHKYRDIQLGKYWTPDK